MSVPLIPAVDYLEAVAVLTACRDRLPFYRDRSQSSEAVYVSVRRGDFWYGVRIAAHEPAYVCSADYEQVIVPPAVADPATLSRAERQVVQAVRHGGRVVALGRFRESVTGDIAPRTVLILVEWESKAAFDAYCNDPELADLHAHRENGSSSYIWHLFDRLDDLRPLLKVV